MEKTVSRYALTSLPSLLPVDLPSTRAGGNAHLRQPQGGGHRGRPKGARGRSGRLAGAGQSGPLGRLQPRPVGGRRGQSPPPQRSIHRLRRRRSGAGDRAARPARRPHARSGLACARTRWYRPDAMIDWTRLELVQRAVSELHERLDRAGLTPERLAERARLAAQALVAAPPADFLRAVQEAYSALPQIVQRL